MKQGFIAIALDPGGKTTDNERRLVMKRSTNRLVWLAIAATAMLCLALAVPVAAQEEEEEAGGTARLGKELTAKLEAIDRWIDILAKVEEGEKLNIGIGELQADLDSLASHSRQIWQHFRQRGEADKVHKIEDLSAAVRDAQAEADKLSMDKSAPKLVVIALGNVVRLGREAGRACFA